MFSVIVPDGFYWGVALGGSGYGRTLEWEEILISLSLSFPGCSKMMHWFYGTILTSPANVVKYQPLTKGATLDPSVLPPANN